MMTELNKTTKCPWIVQVGGNCAPAAAVVGFVPQEQLMDDCSFCLLGNASMNETEHRWQLETVGSNGTLTPVFDTDWASTEAGELCLSPKSKLLGRRIRKNTVYKATLMVKNQCGVVDINTIQFTTPDYSCDNTVIGGPIDVPPTDAKIHPNPGSGTVYYEANITTAGPVSLRVSQMNVGTIVHSYNSDYQPAGQFILEVSTSNWQNGMYHFQLQTNDGVFTTNFIKQ